jgi:hypothetical protein
VLLLVAAAFAVAAPAGDDQVLGAARRLPGRRWSNWRPRRERVSFGCTGMPHQRHASPSRSSTGSCSAGFRVSAFCCFSHATSSFRRMWNSSGAVSISFHRLRRAAAAERDDQPAAMHRFSSFGAAGPPASGRKPGWMT